MEKTVFNGPSAYSSLIFNPVDQRFYLMYEKGDASKGTSPYTQGISITEFDLEWLLSK